MLKPERQGYSRTSCIHQRDEICFVFLATDSVSGHASDTNLNIWPVPTGASPSMVLSQHLSCSWCGAPGTEWVTCQQGTDGERGGRGLARSAAAYWTYFQHLILYTCVPSPDSVHSGRLPFNPHRCVTQHQNMHSVQGRRTRTYEY